jgi:predicted PurR-regulated permease PerM
VQWLETHGLSRSIGSALVVALVATAIVGFFWITGASLASQARELGGTISDVRQKVEDRIPPALRGVAAHSENGATQSAIAGYAFDAGRLLLQGVAALAFILILAIYLLIEGRRTYTWLVAYAPPHARDRVHLTACEARKAMQGYVIGNVATSAFATLVVLVALSLLHVPAALLLALLAGVFDFVPAFGFICSAFPAVLLALTRSMGVAIAVAVIYVGYHTAENYYIGPRVYGDRLKLSSLAVILAFAVGAAIGGLAGALLALPIAALYPVVERVWLKDYLNRDAVETHQRMQRDSTR